MKFTRVVVQCWDNINEEVRPCPLCFGPKVRLIQRFDDEDGYVDYFIECAGVFSDCGYEVKGFEEEDESNAIKSWNDQFDIVQETRRRNCRETLWKRQSWQKQGGNTGR